MKFASSGETPLYSTKFRSHQIEIQFKNPDLKMDLSGLPADLANLPREILVQILGQMPLTEIVRNCQVSPRFNQVCNDPTLWQALIQNDFSWLSTQNVADPRSLYIQTREQLGRVLGELAGRAQVSAQTNTYWPATRQGRRLFLDKAMAYVQKNYPNAKGYDRFVYWPDYRVAGTVNDIVSAFRQRGAYVGDFGKLYRWTNGRAGSKPGYYLVDEERVYRNSIDPLDPNQGELLNLAIEQGREELKQINADKLRSFKERTRREDMYQSEVEKLDQIEGASNGYNGLEQRQLPILMVDYNGGLPLYWLGPDLYDAMSLQNRGRDLPRGGNYRRVPIDVNEGYDSEPLLLVSYRPDIDSAGYAILTTRGNELIVKRMGGDALSGGYIALYPFKVLSIDPQGNVLAHNYPPFNPQIRQQIEFNNIRLKRDQLPPYSYEPYGLKL